MNQYTTRRHMMMAVGAGVLGSVAGCLGSDDTEDSGQTATASQGDDDQSGAQTESPEAIGSEGLVYAFASNRIAMIDPETGEVVDDITDSIDENEWGDVVITHDHSQVFAIEQSLSQAVVINTETRVIDATIDIGPSPVHMYHPKPNEVWVHSDAEGAFYVIDRDTLAVETIVALTGVTLAGTTGLFLTAWHAPTAEALLGTLYGTVLTTKTGLVLFALGIGGVVRFVLLRSLDPTAQGVFGRTQPTPTVPVREDGGESTTLRRVIWGVRIELVVLIGVILLSGMLTSIPTAAVAAGDEGIPQASIETEHDGGVVELSALPADDANDRLFVHEYEPVIYEATFRDQSGEQISSDRTVRLLATHEESDTAIEIDLEETQDGTYATVQALPAHGDWDLRVSGQPEDTFVAEWFELYVIIDHPEHTHDHSHGDLTGEQTPFAGWLGLLGLVVGVIGMVAVSIETIRFGRRQH